MKNRFSVVGIASLASLAISFLAGLSLFYDKKSAARVDADVDITDYSACQTAYNENNASNMLTALRNITSPGSAGSYKDLWTTYTKAYVRDDGTMFDYYSSSSQFTPVTDQAGNYSQEGDVYNREHSKSLSIK